MTEWIYRINVLVPDALRPVLSALWTIIAPEGDPESLSFSVPLSPLGQAPPTHWGMSTAATDEMVTLITQIFTDDLVGCFVSVQDYTVNDWDAFIASHGLKVNQTELIV